MAKLGFNRVQYRENQKEIARINRNTGVLSLNRSIWTGLPTDQKEFVLLHEQGHLVMKTPNELEANKYAIRNFVKAGELSNRELGQKIIVMRDILDKADDNPESGFTSELISSAGSGILSGLAVLGIGSKARAKEAAATADAQIQLLTAETEASKVSSKNMVKILLIVGVIALVGGVTYITLRK